jgi:hypothetical protein
MLFLESSGGEKIKWYFGHWRTLSAPFAQGKPARVKKWIHGTRHRTSVRLRDSKLAIGLRYVPFKDAAIEDMRKRRRDIRELLPLAIDSKSYLEGRAVRTKVSHARSEIINCVHAGFLLL